MFLLYYKNDCHYSSNSLNLMKTLGIEYEPILVDDNNQNIKNQLKNKFMHTTMPAIFYLNKIDKVASRTKIPSDKVNKPIFIGGDDNMQKLVAVSRSLTKKSDLRKVFNDEIKDNYKMEYSDFLKMANEICKCL